MLSCTQHPSVRGAFRSFHLLPSVTPFPRPALTTTCARFPTQADAATTVSMSQQPPSTPTPQPPQAGGNGSSTVLYTPPSGVSRYGTPHTPATAGLPPKSQSRVQRPTPTSASSATKPPRKALGVCGRPAWGTPSPAGGAGAAPSPVVRLRRSNAGEPALVAAIKLAPATPSAPAATSAQQPSAPRPGPSSTTTPVAASRRRAPRALGGPRARGSQGGGGSPAASREGRVHSRGSSLSGAESLELPANSMLLKPAVAAALLARGSGGAGAGAGDHHHDEGSVGQESGHVHGGSVSLAARLPPDERLLPLPLPHRAGGSGGGASKAAAGQSAAAAQPSQRSGDAPLPTPHAHARDSTDGDDGRLITTTLLVPPSRYAAPLSEAGIDSIEVELGLDGPGGGSVPTAADGLLQSLEGPTALRPMPSHHGARGAGQGDPAASTPTTLSAETMQRLISSRVEEDLPLMQLSQTRNVGASPHRYTHASGSQMRLGALSPGRAPVPMGARSPLAVSPLRGAVMRESPLSASPHVGALYPPGAAVGTRGAGLARTSPVWAGSVGAVAGGVVVSASVPPTLPPSTAHSPCTALHSAGAALLDDDADVELYSEAGDAPRRTTFASSDGGGVGHPHHSHRLFVHNRSTLSAVSPDPAGDAVDSPRSGALGHRGSNSAGAQHDLGSLGDVSNTSPPQSPLPNPGGSGDHRTQPQPGVSGRLPPSAGQHLQGWSRLVPAHGPDSCPEQASPDFAAATAHGRVPGEPTVTPLTWATPPASPSAWATPLSAQPHTPERSTSPSTQPAAFTPAQHMPAHGAPTTEPNQPPTAAHHPAKGHSSGVPPAPSSTVAQIHSATPPAPPQQGHVQLQGHHHNHQQHQAQPMAPAAGTPHRTSGGRGFFSSLFHWGQGGK